MYNSTNMLYTTRVTTYNYARYRKHLGISLNAVMRRNCHETACT